MINRPEFLLAAALCIGVCLGCQSQPQNYGPATPPSPEEADPMPQDFGAPTGQGGAPAGGQFAGPSGDPNSPLQFPLTDEERARGFGHGPGGGLPTLDPGAIADAVPESLKSGPVGSLGGAIFKGIVGAAGSSSAAGSDAPEGDTPGDKPDGDSGS